MPPKKGEPGYAEYRERYNARRRKRFQDPEYEQREKSLMKQRRERRKAQQSSRQRKANENHDKES